MVQISFKVQLKLSQTLDRAVFNQFTKFESSVLLGEEVAKGRRKNIELPFCSKLINHLTDSTNNSIYIIQNF